mmetsp:Transcript_32165/g.48546  ORF Transcript_32165/g.48546 Transcript_32165/m.48546 type:complete len:94 (-) Transcript_32165:415-696(-)
MFHNVTVLEVQFVRELGQFGMVQTELVVPFGRHEFSSPPGLSPYVRKVPRRTKILCHSHRFGQIQYGMPPTVGDKDGLTRVLGKFETTKIGIF